MSVGMENMERMKDRRLDFEFTTADLEEIKGHGLSPELAARQVIQMRRGVSPVRPLDAVRPDNGYLLEFDRGRLISLAGRFRDLEAACPSLYFVPAAGAASRLFRLPREVVHFGADLQTNLKRLAAAGRRADRASLRRLFSALRRGRLPFSTLLAERAEAASFNLDRALEHEQADQVFKFMLEDLGLESLPKALLPVHHYRPSENRTALEEHIRFAARLCPQRTEIHLAVSPEHLEKVRDAAEEVRCRMLREGQPGDFIISFSYQAAGSDALALDLRDGRPLRDPADGKLVIRRAGHGSLLNNLNSLDHVHGFWVRNIDNVTREGLNSRLVSWRRAMRGLAGELEAQLHAFAGQAKAGPLTDAECSRILAFVREKLHCRGDFAPLLGMPSQQRSRALLDLLDRPLALVGYVPLPPGQKGGGGFVLPMTFNCAGLPLRVEKASTVEIHELEGGRENEVFQRRAAYFNPVDLYLTRRDFQGRPFDFRRFCDQRRAMVDQKDLFPGLPSKIWEHPGLWNGALAYAFQVSLVLPAFAFAPIKEVHDLLDRAHAGR